MTSVAFGAKGRTMATADSNGRVRLWDLRALNELRSEVGQYACDITDGGLSRFEWPDHVEDLAYEDTCPDEPS